MDHDRPRSTSANRRFVLLAPLLVATALAACQSAAPSSAPGGGSPGATGPVRLSSEPDGATPAPVDGTAGACDGPDIAGIAEARAAIEATNLADEATIQALETVRFTDAGVAASAQALAAGVRGGALWAATWIYASSFCPVGPLTPLLQSDNPTIRAMAAAAHVALGAEAGIPVLGDLLGADGRFEGATPPLLLSEFASATLAAYVDGPPIDDPSDSVAAAQAWSAWLAGREAALQWNPGTGRWSAP